MTTRRFRAHVFATPCLSLCPRRDDMTSPAHLHLSPQVYAWGCGACLGCGSSEATALRPKLIEELATTRVVDISIGDSHCLALSHGTRLLLAPPPLSFLFCCKACLVLHAVRFPVNCLM